MALMEEKSGSEYDPTVCLVSPPSQAPWLVYTHAENETIQTWCMVSPLPSNNKSYVKSIPELSGKEILDSCNGWLILQDIKDKTAISVLNFASLRAINLPPLDLLDQETVTIFSGTLILPPHHHVDDNSTDYMVVVLFAEESMAFSCRLGMSSTASNTCTWASRRIEIFDKNVEVTRVVTCNGVLYCAANIILDDVNGVIDSSRLLIIEVPDNTDEYCDADVLNNHPLLVVKSFDLELATNHHCFCECEVCYLVESCGQVYYVKVSLQRLYGGKHIRSVGVWELNLSSMKWDRVESLEDRALFVGHKGSSWCFASTNNDEEPGGIEANCVYIIHPICKDLLCQYRLKDCSLTHLSPCPNFQAPCEFSLWVTSLHQRQSPVHKLNAEKIVVCDDDIQCQGLEEGNKKEDSLELLLELPLEVLRLIAQRVHLFDYLNFRTTCKTLNSASPPVQWRSNNWLPILMLFENNDRLCRIMDPCRNDSRYLVFPHEPFRGSPVSMFFCNDGWLVLRTMDRRSLHFLNPFTRETGTFPYFEHMRLMYSVGFSTCPTSVDCLTVAISGFGLWYFHSGEDKWHSYQPVGHGLEFQQVPFKPSLSCPVYYEGAFCFLDSQGQLGKFQLVEGVHDHDQDQDQDQVITWDVYDRPSELISQSFDSIHLVECNGELHSVFIGEMGRWIQVFKFNWLEKKWARLQSLPNHILFVSLASSFSIVVSECELGNRIYLPKQRGDCIVFYDLGTSKYNTLMGEDSYEDLLGVSEHPHPFYVAGFEIFIALLS